MRCYQLLACFLSILLLFACKNDIRTEAEVVESSEVDDSASHFNPHKGPIQPVCSPPPPIKDIWALEPMLVEKGEITENMNIKQREAVIREYISKKNSVYENCLKGKL